MKCVLNLLACFALRSCAVDLVWRLALGNHQHLSFLHCVVPLELIQQVCRGGRPLSVFLSFGLPAALRIWFSALFFSYLDFIALPGLVQDLAPLASTSPQLPIAGCAQDLRDFEVS